MKYRLLKDLVNTKKGYEFDPSSNLQGDDVYCLMAALGIDNKEFFEVIKESVYDLKGGDESYLIYNSGIISKNSNSWEKGYLESGTVQLTEKDAKRELAFRKLRNRPIKFLPKEGDKYYMIDLFGNINYNLWDNDSYDIFKYNLGIVFRSKEEANEILTTEIKELLFT